jgi:hypothetical protein
MWRRMLPACLAVGLTATALSVPTLSTAAVAACSDVAATESAAAELAASCGEPVVVDNLRNEYSQVIAQPDGRMTFESSVLPERVRRGSSWVDVNLDLAPGSDNLLRPVASVADVAFSNGGGTTPLVTLTRAGRTMTMSWPGVLPPPTIEKNAAKYTEVLSGVDLVVRATETGFTHVLVVKSAAAAATSAVREIKFDLGGDAQIEAADGALRAMSSGSVLASTEPAMMWDSRPAATIASKTTRSALQAAAASSPSTAEAAGDAARVAPVQVALSAGDLVLRPDASLLEKATFPLYIDPAWSVAKAKWAYSTNNGSNNTDYSTARVGLNPDTGALYRSFFQFSTTANGVSLAGKQILSARVEMELDHSWSCDKTVASMYWSSAIDATMKATWSKMKLLRYLDSATGRANQAGGCGVIQGDQDMVFQGAAVTSFVRSAAKDKWTNLTVGFTARDADGDGESTQSRWKKFLPKNAKLWADYNSIPTAPGELYAGGVKCGSGAVSVGTFTPSFSAKFHDADGTRDSLTGVFEWIEIPAAGMGSVTDNSPARKKPPANMTNVSAGASATSETVAVERLRKYAFRARTVDKHEQGGPWSAWCQFTVDTAVPQVEGEIVSNATAPGRKIRVRIKSTSPDVTKFRYGWDNGTKEVAASTTTPKFAEVEVTAQRLGTNQLNIKAIDATLNEGTGVLPIDIIGQPIAPVARWGLETYPGASSPASALADRAPALPVSPLTAANVTWVDDARVISGQTATFNGGSSATTTSAAVVNTTGAFGVAAWVRLESLPTGDVTVASQDGTSAAGFELGVRRTGTPAAPYWSFAMKDTSAQSSATVAALSPTALTSADVGRWIHVAGSYDPVEKKVRLLVDGVKVAEVDRSAAPWSATGRFAVGRGFTGGAASGFWNGSIADVQVFDRVLVPDDFTGRLKSLNDGISFDEPALVAPLQVGGWDFSGASACKITNLNGFCQAPDRSAWDRSLALSRGAAIGAARDTNQPALWLDDQFFAADDGTVPDEVTSEYGRSAVKTGTTLPDENDQEFTLWQDEQVLRTDDSFTVSVWAIASAEVTGSRTVIAQRGTNESAFWLAYNGGSGKWVFTVGSQDVLNADASTMTTLASAEDAVPEVWTHLTAVYDAGAKQTRLYVNGTAAGTSAVTDAPFNATGPLLAGKTFYHGALTDQWHGGIDDITVFQGAMNDAAVSVMYQYQSTDTSTANELHKTKTLVAGEALRSLNGVYELRMQTDGNLVLYRQGTPVWSPNTWGNPGAYTVMQADGNMVIYKGATPLWHSNTWRSAADHLVLFDDGRLELHDVAGQVIWRRPQ